MEREKALDMAVSQIERQYGQGAIMKMGEAAKRRVDVIPTGALSLDLALGIGGVPRGRIVELYGPESSGKTTVALHIVAEAQRNGGIAAFIDAEHALDPIYAKAIGVDVDELLISQPDTGEQALEIADMLIRSGALDVLVIDSVAALVPRAEIEGEMGDAHVGLQARLMSQALRKLTGAVNRSNTSVIFTNQIREKVGVMFGSPETQPGGRALKFYSSQRLDIRRIETLKEGTDAVGNRVRVKVVKNKVAAPFRQAEFDIEYGVGISSEGCILDLGLEHNLVSKSGSFFSYGEERIGQGRNNAKAYLRDNPKVAKEIEAKIYEAVGTQQGGTVAEIAFSADPQQTFMYVADGPNGEVQIVTRADGKPVGRFGRDDTYWSKVCPCSRCSASQSPTRGGVFFCIIGRSACADLRRASRPGAGAGLSCATTAVAIAATRMITPHINHWRQPSTRPMCVRMPVTAKKAGRLPLPPPLSSSEVRGSVVGTSRREDRAGPSTPRLGSVGTGPSSSTAMHAARLGVARANAPTTSGQGVSIASTTCSSRTTPWSVWTAIPPRRGRTLRTGVRSWATAPATVAASTRPRV